MRIVGEGFLTYQ